MGLNFLIFESIISFFKTLSLSPRKRVKFLIIEIWGRKQKRLRTIYKKIENLIVDGSRIFLTILSLISLLLVFVTTILGTSFYFDKPNINTTKLPDWSFYENELFPRINNEPLSKDENSENSSVTEFLISKDLRFFRILNSFFG